MIDSIFELILLAAAAVAVVFFSWAIYLTLAGTWQWLYAAGGF